MQHQEVTSLQLQPVSADCSSCLVPSNCLVLSTRYLCQQWVSLPQPFIGSQQLGVCYQPRISCCQPSKVPSASQAVLGSLTVCCSSVACSAPQARIAASTYVCLAAGTTTNKEMFKGWALPKKRPTLGIAMVGDQVRACLQGSPPCGFCCRWAPWSAIAAVVSSVFLSCILCLTKRRPELHNT